MRVKSRIFDALLLTFCFKIAYISTRYALFCGYLWLDCDSFDINVLGLRCSY